MVEAISSGNFGYGAGSGCVEQFVAQGRKAHRAQISQRRDFEKSAEVFSKRSCCDAGRASQVGHGDTMAHMVTHVRDGLLDVVWKHNRAACGRRTLRMPR